MESKQIFFLLIASAILLSFSGHVLANDTEELESLRALLQQMNQKMESLERRVQSAEESATKREHENPVIISNQDKYNSGFGIQSADGRNKIQFGGLIQLDNRQYFEKNIGDIKRHKKVNF